MLVVDRVKGVEVEERHDVRALDDDNAPTVERLSDTVQEVEHVVHMAEHVRRHNQVSFTVGDSDFCCDGAVPVERQHRYARGLQDVLTGLDAKQAMPKLLE